MGKRKPQKPLCIAVTRPEMEGWEEISELREKGHSIVTLDTKGADLILGPECHLMNEVLQGYVNLAVREAKERIYGKRGEKDEVAASGGLFDRGAGDDAGRDERGGESTPD